VLDEARPELSPEEQAIADYLFGSFDSRGLLTASLEDVAIALDVSAAHVARVLEILRSMDSPGLGARDIRECLLLQLAQLDRNGVSQELAYTVIAQHLDLLASRGADPVAAALNVPVEKVHAAVSFIRAHLCPSALGTVVEPWA